MCMAMCLRKFACECVFWFDYFCLRLSVCVCVCVSLSVCVCV